MLTAPSVALKLAQAYHMTSCKVMEYICQLQNTSFKVEILLYTAAGFEPALVSLQGPRVTTTMANRRTKGRGAVRLVSPVSSSFALPWPLALKKLQSFVVAIVSNHSTEFDLLSNA